MKNLSAMAGTLLKSVKRMSVWDIIGCAYLAYFIPNWIVHIKQWADVIMLALFLIFLISSFFLPKYQKHYFRTNKTVVVIYGLSLIGSIVFLIYTW